MDRTKELNERMKTEISLRKFLKSKRGLSAPVGNLIILIAAVLLATVVVVYAVNVTASQVQKEKAYIAVTHVWYVNSSVSIAAIGISDIGPTDMVLTKIEVDGMQIDWNGTSSFAVYCDINGSIPGDLPLAEQLSNTGNTTIIIGGQSCNFDVAHEALTIKSGYSIAFYVVVPNLVSVYDLSTPIEMTITTGQGVYFTETVVQNA